MTYGDNPIHLEGMSSKTTICNGLTFSFVNWALVAQTEIIENRARAVATDSGAGRGCSWDDGWNVMQSYLFEWEDEWSTEDSYDEVIRC
jgi:hypothetical protein